jgi:hypothetical protein
MFAADMLTVDMSLSHWDKAKDGLLLDVGEPIELAVEKLHRLARIPTGERRGRLGELAGDL